MDSISKNLKINVTEKSVNKLLKEAFRCTKYLRGDDKIGDKILEWLGLLETLNESLDNINEQSLLVELVGLLCVDFKNNGVSLYQNKCLDFVYPNLGEINKKVGLLYFKLHHHKPAIIFNKESINILNF